MYFYTSYYNERLKFRTYLHIYSIQYSYERKKNGANNKKKKKLLVYIIRRQFLRILLMLLLLFLLFCIFFCVSHNQIIICKCLLLCFMYRFSIRIAELNIFQCLAKFPIVTTSTSIKWTLYWFFFSFFFSAYKCK